VRRQCEGGAGDTTMTSKTLVGVLTMLPTAPSCAGAAPNPKGPRIGSIHHAKQPPVPAAFFDRARCQSTGVTQRISRGPGYPAVFDTRANLITMLGGVVLNPNVQELPAARDRCWGHTTGVRGRNPKRKSAGPGSSSRGTGAAGPCPSGRPPSALGAPK